MQPYRLLSSLEKGLHSVHDLLVFETASGVTMKFIERNITFTTTSRVFSSRFSSTQATIEIDSPFDGVDLIQE